LVRCSFARGVVLLIRSSGCGPSHPQLLCVLLSRILVTRTLTLTLTLPLLLPILTYDGIPL
jgi:hypothetical protein